METPLSHLHHHPRRRHASVSAVAGRNYHMTTDHLKFIACVLRDAVGFVVITAPLWLLLAVVAVQMGVL